MRLMYGPNPQRNAYMSAQSSAAINQSHPRFRAEWSRSRAAMWPSSCATVPTIRSIDARSSQTANLTCPRACQIGLNGRFERSLLKHRPSSLWSTRHIPSMCFANLADSASPRRRRMRAKSDGACRRMVRMTRANARATRGPHRQGTPSIIRTSGPHGMASSAARCSGSPGGCDGDSVWVGGFFMATMFRPKFPNPGGEAQSRGRRVGARCRLRAYGSVLRACRRWSFTRVRQSGCRSPRAGADPRRNWNRRIRGVLLSGSGSVNVPG